MSDWTPKEIDKLFQDGSTKHEFEYNEAAWGKMEILLDDQDRRKRRLLWWWLLGGLLSVLLMISGFYFYKQKKQAVQTKETTEIPVEEQLSKNSTPVNLTKPISNNPSIETNLTKDIAQKPVGGTTTSLDNAALKRTQTKIKHASTTTQEEETATTNAKTVLPTTTANHLASEVTVLGKETTTSPDELLLKQEVQHSAKRRGAAIELNALPTLSSTIDFANELILLDTAFSNQPITRVQKKTNNNHFVVGVLLARELSFVDEGLCDPNWKVGLSLAYRFGRKYSLRLEGSYVKKEYAASGDKYIAPQGFWENGIIPQMAIGTCNIIEASITQSYFFKGHAARGFYIDAGLSSFFMLREQYNYNFDSANQGLRSAWGTRNENQHWFGIGEIAVGYNLPFADKSSLQLAPYTQIPLTGIGHGQVKFFSLGVHLRYNFRL